jgi:alkanesulfonate monooxygenase SsuD/methylene tetrahydromethanopterin reductase-like flavin-dependent oxidoreductase (luciferase family)
LGALDDIGFGGVGEATEARVRAELLDESLEILTRAWSGELFSFDGAHYRMAEMTMRPPSRQQPRIPIWVVAAWPRPKSVERALRYDGIIPQVAAEGGGPGRVTPEQVRAIGELARERRPDGEPFEIVIGDVSPADDPEAARALARPLAEAGATWWIESPWMNASTGSLRERIAAGPPK